MGEQEIVFERVKNLNLGQHRIYCPQCHPSRKKHNQHQKELAVNIDNENIKYYCHHCGINGGLNKNFINIKRTITSEKAQEVMREINLENYKHSNSTLKFLQARKIDDDVIDKYSLGNVYSFQGRKREGIGFPYLDEENKVTAIKWRSADTDKLFSMEGNCNTFFNINSVVDENSLIICEGEIDALTWMSVLKEKEGIAVVSVPNGASNKISENIKTPQEDTKYKYVWSAREKLNSLDEIIFSGDSDEQGSNLLEELARRIGRAKCWLIDLSPYKDANECLQKEGKDFLLERLQQRKPYPVSGLYRAVDIRSKVDQLYTEGKPTGYDIHSAVPLQIAMKQMTVVTGLPSSGKSNFVDDCCVYLAQTYGLKICYASFEKPMTEHITQLATHISGKIFFETDGVERISEEELDASMSFINDHFVFQDFSGGRSTKIVDVLDIASASVMWGAKILVIDPYNWIETEDGGNISEVVSNILTRVQGWAVANDAHVFFVAHPSKLQDRSRIPEGMEIQNSMSWFAKTDNGITIHRDEERNPLCKIWKVRWSWLGSPQTVHLNHNSITGCFTSKEAEKIDWSFADSFVETEVFSEDDNQVEI